METITHTETMVTASCPECGVLHAFPQFMKECALGNRKRLFFCPNGHTWSYLQEPWKDKYLREQQEADQLKAKTRELEADLTKTMASLDKSNAAKRKFNRLMETGTCPCCRRNFVNLRKHMNHKHPEFVGETA